MPRLVRTFLEVVLVALIACTYLVIRFSTGQDQLMVWHPGDTDPVAVEHAGSFGGGGSNWITVTAAGQLIPANISTLPTGANALYGRITTSASTTAAVIQPIGTTYNGVVYCTK